MSGGPNTARTPCRNGNDRLGHPGTIPQNNTIIGELLVFL